MTTNERRRKIRYLLRVKRRESVATLAQVCGVTARTIRRDIVRMSAELPIYTVPGPGGGVFMLEERQREDLLLTSRQVKMLGALLGRLLSENTVLSEEEEELLCKIFGE